ncbi:hypothetical protein HHI36_004564 [Cryptolaemus montrouzieri]|uniref:Methyltransferase domain-containing protein n=1 Tax=Cryptolaemus montrouzieri TaxID=559131 RepID=A0ABD2NSC4_9CUCU
MTYAKHVIQHTKFSCTLEKIRNTYKTWSKSFDLPKNGPLACMDVGCGSGRVLIESVEPLLPENYSELVGIDIDHSMIEYCKSLKVDSRISFEQMDIGTDKLPEKFNKRFNLLFSFFCLMYVRDFRQALRNSSEMLKPNGELLYMFMFKKNLVWECYKDLSRKKIWKPYTQEFADFLPLYAGEDRDLELKDDFSQAKLEVVNHEFQSNYSIRTSRSAIIDLLQSMNTIYYSVPGDKKEEFRKDFAVSMSNIIGCDFMDEGKLDEEYEVACPTVVIHARKKFE